MISQAGIVPQAFTIMPHHKKNEPTPRVLCIVVFRARTLSAKTLKNFAPQANACLQHAIGQSTTVISTAELAERDFNTQPRHTAYTTHTHPRKKSTLVSSLHFVEILQDREKGDPWLFDKQTAQSIGEELEAGRHKPRESLLYYVWRHLRLY